jgi:CheY-like chemotaxis protein
MEVLVADGEATAQAYAEWLRAEGHEVTCADGPAALAELGRRPWDVLFVDILMPVVDGLEVIMAARKLEQPPRIVAMSGGGLRGSWEYLRLADVLGADLCLSKPLDPNLVTWAARPAQAAVAAA